MDKQLRAELFNDSFQRCLAHDDFIDRFYDRFIQSDPKVAAKFEHTDMDNQKSMLKASLYSLMSASLGTVSAVDNIREIGRVHNRKNKDINPAFYEVWLKALVETVSETDQQFSLQVEQAWRETLLAGIEIMRAEY